MILRWNFSQLFQRIHLFVPNVLKLRGRCRLLERVEELHRGNVGIF